MSIKSIIEGVDATSASFKPHKLLMLLAISKQYEQKLLFDANVFFSPSLISIFSDLFKTYAKENDRNRPHTPFFHLKSMPFWSLVAVQEKEAELSSVGTVGEPSQLAELVDHAVISSEYLVELLDKKRNHELQDAICKKLVTYRSTQSNPQGEVMNPFVRYINSLNSMDSDNKGALAEAQATEPLFCEIQVPHPWAKKITTTLTSPTGRSVILSGHAGDGKSTLVIEVLKKLRDIAEDALLPGGLQKRMELPELKLVVVKDLSEWNKKEKNDLFAEMMAGENRFLLISNTGTLLDLFKQHASSLEKRPVEIENLLLTALDSVEAKTLQLSPLSFEVYNLAQRDNVSLAMKLLDKLVHSDKWSSCAGCTVRDKCPVAFNHTLMRDYYDCVSGRIRLLYARAYAYGSCLTMRQIGAHFAYLMTAGLDCKTIHDAVQSGHSWAMTEYCFFNRFWGDNGCKDVAERDQLKAFAVLDEQAFNMRYSPQQERIFWQHIEGLSFHLGVPELEDLFARVLKVERKADTDDATATAARRQLRRMAYFLHTPTEEKTKAGFARFQAAFLNSPMILEFREWQRAPLTFRSHKNGLQDALFCVLQEQFCGVMPPEGTLTDKMLYITLNRHTKDVRQSAQLVLRSVKFSSNFSLAMENGILRLMGTGNDVKGITLPISLPFLDYIVARKAGELGRGLQVAYRDRLEKLMAQLVEKLPPDNDRLTLLQQGEDGTLSTQTLTVENDMMEVTYD